MDIVGKMGSTVNIGSAGVLSTAVVCTHQYVKARTQGANAEEALSAIRKTAVSSLSLQTISLIAQGIGGGPACIIVSTGAGLLYFSANTGQTVHTRKMELRIREYTVEEYRRFIDKKEFIYIN